MKTLRRRMLARRDALPPDERTERSRAAVRNLLPQLDGAACVCTYLSIGSEVETALVVEHCFKEGKRIAVPVIRKSITLAELTGRATLVAGAYGIGEPEEFRAVDRRAVDVFVVPGIAFDALGNRIGYGKGYYDSLLSSSGGKKIGLCYDFQVVSSIRARRKDVPMDEVVTDKAVIIP